MTEEEKIFEWPAGPGPGEAGPASEEPGPGEDRPSRKSPRLFPAGRKRVFPAVLVAIPAAAAFFLLFLSGRGPDRPAGKVLAVVNGEKITSADFERYLEGLPDYYRAYATANRSQFLHDLVDRELIYQQARRGEYARTAELRIRVRDFEKELLVQEFVNREILADLEFSQSELRRHYEENIEDFTIPGGVQLAVILVTRRSRADEILARIASGEDFHDLAREFSGHPSRLEGGDLGLVRRGDLPGDLAEAAFSLAPGQVSAPLQTETGYYLFRVSGRLPERRMSFEDAEPEIRRRLSGARGEEAFRQFVRDLRNRSRIRIEDENLENLVF